jgi:hypothetical protein
MQTNLDIGATAPANDLVENVSNIQTALMTSIDRTEKFALAFFSFFAGSIVTLVLVLLTR